MLSLVLHYRPPIDNWSTGRTTMLGDSVHATLPYLAQGACMAIEDGAVLTRALIFATIFRTRRSSISATGWSAARIVEQSDANRTLFHMPSMEAIRAHFAKVDEGADRNGCSILQSTDGGFGLTAAGSPRRFGIPR